MKKNDSIIALQGACSSYPNGHLSIPMELEMSRRKRPGCMALRPADNMNTTAILLSELPVDVSQRLREFFPYWAPIHNPIDTRASVEKVGPQESFNRILEIYMESGLLKAIVLMTISSPFASFDWKFINDMLCRALSFLREWDARDMVRRRTIVSHGLIVNS